MKIESFDRWVWGAGSHGVLGRVVGYCSDGVRCTVGVCGEDGTLAGKWVRIFPSVIEVFLCWIFVPVSKIFTSFD
nr:hypothetical protein [Tanacetum cinerariifolium]